MTFEIFAEYCTSVLLPYEFLQLPSRKLYFGNFAWFPCFCDCHLRHQNSLYNERKRKMTCALWKDSELDPCQKVLVGGQLVAFGYLKNIIKCLHNIQSKPFLFSYFFVPIIPIRSITFVEDGNFPEMYSEPKGDNNEKKILKERNGQKREEKNQSNCNWKMIHKRLHTQNIIFEIEERIIESIAHNESILDEEAQ